MKKDTVTRFSKALLKTEAFERAWELLEEELECLLEEEPIVLSSPVAARSLACAAGCRELSTLRGRLAASEGEDVDAYDRLQAFKEEVVSQAFCIRKKRRM